jgi:hypothetical protein
MNIVKVREKKKKMMMMKTKKKKNRNKKRDSYKVQTKGWPQASH